MFEQMLYIDALRGPDSTGAFLVNKHGNVRWAKEASLSGKFLSEGAVNSMLTDTVFNGTILVGHNRKATFGKVTDENAHPFIEDNIILVHNGTLRNHKTLNKEVEVDSHAMTHAIKEFGVEKAIKRIDGAFAVATYDVKAKKFYLFRNSERPLWLAEGENAWFFASEPWMIFGTAWRNEIKGKAPVQIDVGKIYSFDISGNDVVLKTKGAKLYTPPPVVVVPAKKHDKKLALVPNTPKKGRMDLIDTISRFSRGSVVCFHPKEVTLNGQYNKIHGIHYKYPHIKIVVFVEGGAHYATQLSKERLLTAEVTSVNADANLGYATIYCRNCTTTDEVYTVSGEMINDEQMQHLSGQCSQCTKEIQEDELEASFYKEKGEIVKHYCPACVAANVKKNPNWGGLNQLGEAA